MMIVVVMIMLHCISSLNVIFRLSTHAGTRGGKGKGPECTTEEKKKVIIIVKV
jgi:hypothetical protein